MTGKNIREYNDHMLKVAALASVVLCPMGCTSSEGEIPLASEDSTSYGYTSFDREGMVLTKGTISMPPLTPGGRKFVGHWESQAVRDGDHVSFQTGTGALEGYVSGQSVFLEFHPRTARTDYGFELKGKLTLHGAEGEWWYTDFVGVHPNQGAFTLVRSQ